MTAKPDLPIVQFASRDAWEAWLAQQHATSNGLWLKIAKKGSGIDTVSYAEALEVVLCYGWIDGQKDKLDADWWLQRFTPRRERSRWSKVNRAKAIELIESGEMRPAGLREVERAKADGRWGRRVRGAEHGRGPGRPAASAREGRQGASVLLEARQPKQVRDPLPDPGGQEARDPRAPHRDVRDNAERGEEAASLKLTRVRRRVV